MSARRDPRLFDRTRPLAMARFATLYEHEMAAGDPLTIIDGETGGDKGEIPLGIAVRLWVSGQAVYADDLRPTPFLSPEQEAARVVTLEPTGGGWYIISAPWLDEGVKVRGKEEAETRRDEIVKRGDTKGVTVTGGDGGWYEVAAPWADEPEKVQGQDAANARADELIAAGPPQGWRKLSAEEIAAAKDQDDLAAEARRIADEEVAKASAADQRSDALAAGFTDAEWDAVPEAERADALKAKQAEAAEGAKDAVSGSADADAPVVAEQPADDADAPVKGKTKK